MAGKINFGTALLSQAKITTDCEKVLKKMIMVQRGCALDVSPPWNHNDFFISSSWCIWSDRWMSTHKYFRSFEIGSGYTLQMKMYQIQCCDGRVISLPGVKYFSHLFPWNLSPFIFFIIKRKRKRELLWNVWHHSLSYNKIMWKNMDGQPLCLTVCSPFLSPQCTHPDLPRHMAALPEPCSVSRFGFDLICGRLMRWFAI